MSEILSKTDAAIYGPDVIKSDKPANGYTYVDVRGVVRHIDADASFGSNYENVLGPKYLEKMAGSAWEAIWKTAATFIPAGKTLKAAIALTALKIGTKSVGTAGNYVITGEYTSGKAIKKALIINAATPTNYAPIATAAFAKNTLVGKTFGSYYKTLSGDGKSSNPLQKGRIDYIEFHTPKWLGHQHLHGSIYPLNPLLQAESKAIGYTGYNIISGKNPFEVAHANQIHSNDVQHNSNVNETHHQGAAEHGNVKSHAQAEPKSGGQHEEAAYEGGLLPWSVEVTRAASNRIKSAYQEGIDIESGIDKETAIWDNKINNSVGVVDKTIEFLKGTPAGLKNALMKDIIYINRYVSIPLFNLLASGVAESVEAIDKTLVNGANYALAAGNVAAAKLSDALTHRGGAYVKSPFEEVVMVTDIRGNKTSTVINKVRTDNSKISQKPIQRLAKDVKNQQKQADEAFNKLMGGNMNKLYANMQASGTEQRAAQSAMYGAAGKPNAKFSGYTGFGSPIPNIAGVGIQRNATNGPTISQTRK